MKKRNWIFKIASGLMMACLLTTCVISGTFAKFTSGASASTTVNVATWSFNFEDENTKTFAVELAETTELGGAADEQVDTTNKGILAPGTQGSFSITLQNQSQVTADYTVAFTAEAKHADDSASALSDNLKFSLTGGDDYVVFANLAGTNGTLKFENDGDDDETTITVYWKWEFTNEDETEFAGDKITIKATIDLTQVN